MRCGLFADFFPEPAVELYTTRRKIDKTNAQRLKCVSKVLPLLLSLSRSPRTVAFVVTGGDIAAAAEAGEEGLAYIVGACARSSAYDN